MENKKYERLTKSLVYPLIEKYYASGELPSVFYRREGLSESQFYTWRQKYLRDHPAIAKKLGVTVPAACPSSKRRHVTSVPTERTKSSSSKPAVGSGFVRIEPSISSSSVTPSSAAHYELSYPNGVVVRLPDSVSESVLSMLIRLY